MIIDDHSCFLVGGELFYTDTAYNFQKMLKDAVAAHGIPAKLYVDNCTATRTSRSPSSAAPSRQSFYIQKSVTVHPRSRSRGSSGR